MIAASHLLPAGAFGEQVLAPGGRELIHARALIALRHLPLRADPALPLQPMQRRIQRSGIHLEDVGGMAPQRLADAVAVVRAPLQRLEDQEIKRSLQELDPVLVARALDHGCGYVYTHGCRELQRF